MRLTLALATCVLLVAAEGKSKDKKSDHPFEGVWKVASLVANGNEIDDAKGSKFTFKGDKVARQTPDGEEMYTFKINPTKKPAEIDFTPESGDNKGKTLKGVYVLKDGELRVALSLDPDAKRPTEVPKESSDLVLITLKHDSASKKTPPLPKTDSKKD